MGRGNVCVTGPYEGLYYIDGADYEVYRRREDNDEQERRLFRDVSLDEIQSGEWQYDDLGTADEYGDILERFKESFIKMFGSFTRPGKEMYVGYDMYVLLENKLFYIVEQDNQWSTAIKLIQKHDDYGEVLAGLQKRHYLRYLEGMKIALLERLPSIGTYGGAWTSGVIRREELLV